MFTRVSKFLQQKKYLKMKFDHNMKFSGIFISTIMLLFNISVNAIAKTPSKCLEIESILVDACNLASPEPYSEMVRFRVGSNPINISSIHISGAGNSGVFTYNKWPNPNQLWHGIVQNGKTALKTAALNSTVVTSCGKLLEPPTGVIPAGKEVILVASKDINTTDNSFANLADTIYIIYQDTVSFANQGHFANYGSTSSLRHFALGIGNGTSFTCADTVAYNISKLSNSDGATVEFDWAKLDTAHYVNPGCKAPFAVVSLNPTAKPSAICASGSIIIHSNATGPYKTISWSGGAGTFSNQTGDSVKYTPAPLENGTIIITVTALDKCNSPVSKSINIAINGLPKATITPSGTTVICSGASVTLTAAGGTTYSWSTGPTSAAIAVSTAGIYTVIVKNSCGVDTAKQIVTVNNAPVVTITSSSATTFCPGDSVALTAHGGSSYTWSTGAATPIITVQTSGIYTVTASNSCGTSTAKQVVVVNSLPAAIIGTNGSTSFCSGGSVTLTAGGGNSYSWSTGAITAAITLSTAGTYTVTVTNTCGSDTAVKMITVTNLPVAQITSSGTTTICSGDSVTLTAGGGNSYLWSTGATTAAISVKTSGTYSVTSSSSCGTATASQSVTVNSIPPLAINLSGSSTFCIGDSLALTASGGSSYTWSTGATTSTITVKTGGVYTVTSTNSCGTGSAMKTITVINLPFATITSSGSTTLCSGDSVTLTAGGGNLYMWSTGATTAAISVKTSGTYSVTSSNSCGGATASQSVTVNSTPALAINLSGSSTFCVGDSLTLTASGGSSYTWSTGATSSAITIKAGGVYTVTSTNSCGTGSATKTITVINLPLATISSSGSTTLCSGDSVTLTAGGGNSYIWSTGATTAAISVKTSGTYSVTSSNSCGTATASQSVTVNSIPTLSINLSGSSTFCPGDSLTLTANGGSSYAWSTGATTSTIVVKTAGVYSVTSANACGTNTASQTITTNSAPSVVINGITSICAGDSVLLIATGGSSYLWSTGSTSASIYALGGTQYSVTTTNPCGSASATATIQVDSVTALFSADSITGTAPLTIHFINKSKGATSYNWDFGGLGTTNTTSPSFTFTDAVTNVTLTATNALGCKSKYTLEIKNPSKLNIPNVFTPNGDGVNDVFKVLSIGIAELSAEIYDRWGLLIYRFSSSNAYWDGTNMSGSFVPEGTYFYLIKATGNDGVKFDERGFITLLK